MPSDGRSEDRRHLERLMRLVLRIVALVTVGCLLVITVEWIAAGRVGDWVQLVLFMAMNVGVLVSAVLYEVER